MHSYKLTRLLAGFTLLTSLVACGGSMEEPTIEELAEQKLTLCTATFQGNMLEIGKCAGYPDNANAFNYPCNTGTQLTSDMFGFWQWIDKCGIPRSSLITLEIPVEQR